MEQHSSNVKQIYFFCCYRYGDIKIDMSKTNQLQDGGRRPN